MLLTSRALALLFSPVLSTEYVTPVIFYSSPVLSRRLSGGVADSVVIESSKVVSLVITGALTLASAIVASVLTSILT